MGRLPLEAQRGQAIVETVIFLPMFIFALFGTIWVVQATVQYERAESAIRYFAQVSEIRNPYPLYSFASMFSQLGSDTLPTILCNTPDTDALSTAPSTYASADNLNTTASAPFWSPSTTPTGQCTQATYWGMQQNAAQHQNNSMDMLFVTKIPKVSSPVNVPPQLSAALGSAWSTTASEVIFDQVGLNVLVACYPSFNASLNASINSSTDTSTSSSTVSAPISGSDLLTADEGQFDYFTVSPSCL
jgi:hypothetical protein